MSTRVNSCACRHAHAYAVAGLLSKTGARSLTEQPRSRRTKGSKMKSRKRFAGVMALATGLPAVCLRH